MGSEGIRLRRHRWIVGILLSFACGACFEDSSAGPSAGAKTGADDSAGDEDDAQSTGNAESSGTDGDSSRPTPHQDPDDDGQTPSLTREDTAALVAPGLETYLAVNAVGVVELVEALTSEFSEGCPPTPEEDSLPEGDTYASWTVEEACTTASGLTVLGDGSVSRTVNTSEQETITRLVLIGESTRLQHSDGRSIEFSGSIFVTTVRGSETIDGFGVNGSFVGDANSQQSIPLLRPDVQASGEMSMRSGEHLVVTGGITSPELAPALSIDFNGVSVRPGLCAMEPSGEVSMRDANGYWHTLRFTSPPPPEQQVDDPFADAECDGCGALSVDGVSAGEVCLAAGALEGLLDSQADQ